MFLYKLTELRNSINRITININDGLKYVAYSLGRKEKLD